MAKFPMTARTGFTKLSGAAPGAAISLTPEDSRFLIGLGEAVAPTPMANTVAPAITGTAQVGEILTCSDGTWTGSNGVITKDWQEDLGGGYVSIPNANGGGTFTLTAAQLGADIRCRVRNINGAGPVYALSNVAGPVIAA